MSEVASAGRRPWTAITREVSPALTHCELTHLERAPIDVGMARAQHAWYEAVLESLGCRIVRLPEDPEHPDSVFVEDTAVVLDEVAVITRPGAASRRGETDAVARALAPFRPLLRLEPPATLDGGDVLVLDRTLIVGLSSRTNAEAVDQLGRLLAPHGYTVRGVPVAGCLHLKSAVTRAGRDHLLVNPDWVDPAAFGGWNALEVAPGEPYAANVLTLEGQVVSPDSFPRTRQRLEAAGVKVHLVDLAELQKAEGAVTCCSLLFRG
jgi:dimethylargininase